MHFLRSQTMQIKCVTQENTGSYVQCVHNSPECRLYLWSIRIKRRYAVLNVPRKQDIVRSPTPVSNFK